MIAVNITSDNLLKDLLQLKGTCLKMKSALSSSFSVFHSPPKNLKEGEIAGNESDITPAYILVQNLKKVCHLCCLQYYRPYCLYRVNCI